MAQESSASELSALAFKLDGSNGLSFNTGVVKGTLTKDGLGEALRTVLVDGDVVLDKNHGLLCPYRFLTPQRRYGFGAWEWPRTGKVLANGAAQLFWGSAPDRPFAFSTVYRWKDARTLDLTVFFHPQTNLTKFEFFVGSYFEKFTKARAYVQDAGDGQPGFVEVTREHGETQFFPINESVLSMVKDGRWNFPPYPMKWRIRPSLASPVSIRTEPRTGASVIIMSPPEDCFGMPMWQEASAQGGVYLSLFGKDMEKGQTAVAHTRLVFGKNFTDAQALEKNAEYLKEMKSRNDDALLTSDEAEAMQRIFAAAPSPVNAARLPDWFSSDVPKPNAQGWIQLFDGKRLRGCTPPAADLESRRIDLVHGALHFDTGAIRFNLQASNVILRVKIRKISGRNPSMDVRFNTDQDGKITHTSVAWLDGARSGGLGKIVNGKWQELAKGSVLENHAPFVEVELKADGPNVGLKLNGQPLCAAMDAFTGGGSLCVGAYRGVADVKSIEAKILDR